MNFVKLGDLETEIGHMPGFFSRGCKVAADELVKIAEKFNCTVDDLIKNDYELTAFKVEQKNELLKVVTALQQVYNKDELMKIFIQMVNTIYKDGDTNEGIGEK
jgi:hypothetical protein